MPALFVMTAILIGFGGSEYENCKDDGIHKVKTCAERLWDGKQELDYSKLND